MTLFQKLKIKLFGKERWRVVGCYCPIRVGDVVVYKKGMHFAIRDSGIARISNNLNREVDERTVYRKVN